MDFILTIVLVGLVCCTIITFMRIACAFEEIKEIVEDIKAIKEINNSREEL